MRKNVGVMSKASSVIKLMLFPPQHSISLIFRDVRRELEEDDIIKVEGRVFKKTASSKMRSQKRLQDFAGSSKGPC